MAILSANGITVNLGDKLIINNLSISVSPEKIMSIVGPNGSGKSTLLKALSRNLKPSAGTINLFGLDIQSYSAQKLASQMAVLHQAARAPSDLTVRDLVEYGRFPHRKWWQNKNKDDEDIVDSALIDTGLIKLANRLVNTLSGGEQQRAWIAMALAQRPRILLLDEPTTYLDIAHQLEIMELIADLNKSQGLTIVMVLHDLNQAAQYSDTIAVLQQGKLYSLGSPREIITPLMLRDIFGVEADIWLDDDGRLLCLAKNRIKAIAATKTGG
jgi:iron complex transport system ATP-binding protein